MAYAPRSVDLIRALSQSIREQARQASVSGMKWAVELQGPTGTVGPSGVCGPTGRPGAVCGPTGRSYVSASVKRMIRKLEEEERSAANPEVKIEMVGVPAPVELSIAEKAIESMKCEVRKAIAELESGYPDPSSPMSGLHIPTQGELHALEILKRIV